MNPSGVSAFLKIGGNPKFADSRYPLVEEELNAVKDSLRNKHKILIFNELSCLLFLCGVHDSLSDTYLAENIPHIVSFIIASEDRFSILLLALEYYESQFHSGKPCYEMRIHFLFLLVRNLEVYEQAVYFTPVLSKQFWLKSFTALMKVFDSKQVHNDKIQQTCQAICYNFFISWNHYPELKLFFLDRMVQLGLFTEKIIMIPGNTYSTGDFEFQSCSTEVLQYLFRKFPEQTNTSDLFQEQLITNYFLIQPQKTEFMLTHPGYRPGFLDWILQTDFSPDCTEATTYIDLTKVAKLDELTTQHKSYINNHRKLNFFGNVCTSDFFYVMLHTRHCPDLTDEQYPVYFCLDGYTMNQHFDELYELILPALWFHLRKDELFYTTTFQHSCMILNGKSVPDILYQKLVKFDATIRESIRILYSLVIIPDLICYILQNIYFPPHHESLNHLEYTYLRQTVFSLCKVNANAIVESKKRKV